MKINEIPIYKLGDSLELIITSLTSDGEGLGEVNNHYKIYVPHVLEKELVQVVLTEIHKTYAKAIATKIIRPSIKRIKAECAHFTVCGGCQLMHYGYSDQLEYKKSKVQTLLLQNNIACKVLPTIPSPLEFKYRSKIQLLTYSKKNLFEVGLYRLHSHEIIPIKNCILHCEQGEEILSKIKTILLSHPIASLKYLLIKNAIYAKEALIIFVTRENESRLLKTISEELLKIVSIKGVLQNINASHDNSILGKEFELIGGRNCIYERILGKKFMITASSFFQVNYQQIEQLYQKAINLAEITKEDIVIDAYCGVGTLAILSADYAKTVFGIEYVHEAILNANKNCELNQILNCHFIAGAAEELLKNFDKCDVIFLNPPRKGCMQEVLNQISRIKPRTIIYISCNPQTLARDLDFLKKEYLIDYVQPYDMFPHTFHVETVVCLKRISSL